MILAGTEAEPDFSHLFLHPVIDKPWNCFRKTVRRGTLPAMKVAEQETLFFSQVTSPIGPLTLVVSEVGVVRVEFGVSTMSGSHLIESREMTAACYTELEEYFAGERRQFTVPLDIRGTEFQKQCWRALLDIPYGQTRSYADIARAVGRPHAFRAVGMANHSNPIAIIVPCHRVLGSNGSLTGYGGGLDLKRKLLDLEQGLVSSFQFPVRSCLLLETGNRKLETVFNAV